MKRLKVLLGAMLLTATMVSAFAFTSKDFHKPLQTRCFQFSTTIDPDNNTVVVPGNYTEVTGSASCLTPKEEICVICFDDTVNPDYLNGSQLNLGMSSPLRSIVLSNFLDAGPSFTTGEGVTFHFRPE